MSISVACPCFISQNIKISLQDVHTHDREYTQVAITLSIPLQIGPRLNMMKYETCRYEDYRIVEKLIFINPLKLSSPALCISKLKKDHNLSFSFITQLFSQIQFV